jgi:hypothetical protein
LLDRKIGDELHLAHDELLMVRASGDRRGDDAVRGDGLHQPEGSVLVGVGEQELADFIDGKGIVAIMDANGCVRAKLSALYEGLDRTHRLSPGGAKAFVAD